MIVETFLRNECQQPRVQKLDLAYDVLKLREETWSIMRAEAKLVNCPGRQLMLATVPGVENPGHYGCGGAEDIFAIHSPIASEKFTEFHPSYRGYYFDKIWQSFPHKIGRMSLLRVNQHSCSAVIESSKDQLLLAIWSLSDVYQLYENHPTWYHIPSDGHVYSVQGGHRHTVYNGTNDPAIYIYFELLEPI